MYKLKETSYFSKWLVKLKDVKGKISIIRSVKRISAGNFGDHKSLGDNVSELRITSGPGYRIYYTMKETEVVLLLIGGDKSTQVKDIEKAKNLAKEYHND